MQSLYAEISRAYFYANSARATYIRFPDDDPRPADNNLCGKLKLPTYSLTKSNEKELFNVLSKRAV